MHLCAYLMFINLILAYFAENTGKLFQIGSI
jgi:hypothetical protein